MARQLTIRGVSDEVGRRLEALAKERERSMNAIVLEILESALAFDKRRRRLERYATWSVLEREELDAAVAAQRTIDHADWS